MGGGILQLVAYGTQDIFLTGNPQITFFKVVYRRHTNFSMEAIQQTYNGTVTIDSSTIIANIEKNGDLISRIWVDIKLSADITTNASHTYMNWTNNTGHAFIKNCEIRFDGKLIDKQYSQWLDVWNEITDHNDSEWSGLNKHSGKNVYLKSQNSPPNNLQLIVPLQFWFCRNPGLAIPLIALQNQNVELQLTTRPLSSLINCDQDILLASDNPTPTILIWVDFIFLDTDERRRFAQVSHEYLIEQVQREVTTMSTSVNLNFTHPVKELVWVIQSASCTNESITNIDATLNKLNNASSTISQGNDYFCYLSNSRAGTEIINGVTSYEGFKTMKLMINGNERFAERKASYFRICQPIQTGFKVPKKHIYMYSYALKPLEHQPSGTCNFSKIDGSKMIFTTDNNYSNETLTVYSINYNILRITSGRGGLAYA